MNDYSRKHKEVKRLHGNQEAGGPGRGHEMVRLRAVLQQNQPHQTSNARIDRKVVKDRIGRSNRGEGSCCRYSATTGVAPHNKMCLRTLHGSYCGRQTSIQTLERLHCVLILTEVGRSTGGGKLRVDVDLPRLVTHRRPPN
jgi:hypothetical protein